MRKKMKWNEVTKVTSIKEMFNEDIAFFCPRFVILFASDTTVSPYSLYNFWPFLTRPMIESNLVCFLLIILYSI